MVMKITYPDVRRDGNLSHPRVDPPENGKQSGRIGQSEIGGCSWRRVRRDSKTARMQWAQRFHNILVAAFISSVYDTDASLPVRTVNRPEDVDGRATFIPRHGRTRLHAHLSLVWMETVVLENGNSARQQRLVSVVWRRTVVVRQQTALVLHPGTVYGDLLLFSITLSNYIFSSPLLFNTKTPICSTVY